MLRALAIAVLVASVAACGKSEKTQKSDTTDTTDTAEGDDTPKPRRRPANDTTEPDTLLAIKQPIETTAMAVLTGVGKAAPGMSKGELDPAVAAIASKVASLELATIEVAFYWFPEKGQEIQTTFDLLLGTNVRVVGLEMPDNDRAWHRIGTAATGLRPISQGFAHVARATELSIKDNGCVRPDLADPGALPAPLRAELEPQLVAAGRIAPSLCERVRGVLGKRFTSKQVVPRRVRLIAKDKAGQVIDVVGGMLAQRRSDGSPLELSLDRVGAGAK